MHINVKTVVLLCKSWLFSAGEKEKGLEKEFCLRFSKFKVCLKALYTFFGSSWSRIQSRSHLKKFGYYAGSGSDRLRNISFVLTRKLASGQSYTRSLYPTARGRIGSSNPCWFSPEGGEFGYHTPWTPRLQQVHPCR